MRKRYLKAATPEPVSFHDESPPKDEACEPSKSIYPCKRNYPPYYVIEIYEPNGKLHRNLTVYRDENPSYEIKLNLKLSNEQIKFRKDRLERLQLGKDGTEFGELLFKSRKSYRMIGYKRPIALEIVREHLKNKGITEWPPTTFPTTVSFTLRLKRKLLSLCRMVALALKWLKTVSKKLVKCFMRMEIH